jgi:hypothetical protein
MFGEMPNPLKRLKIALLIGSDDPFGLVRGKGVTRVIDRTSRTG